MTTMNEVTAGRAKVDAALAMIDSALKGKRGGDIKQLAGNLTAAVSTYTLSLMALRGPVVPPPTDTKPRPVA